MVSWAVIGYDEREKVAEATLPLYDFGARLPRYGIALLWHEHHMMLRIEGKSICARSTMSRCRARGAGLSRSRLHNKSAFLGIAMTSVLINTPIVGAKAVQMEVDIDVTRSTDRGQLYSTVRSEDARRDIMR